MDRKYGSNPVASAIAWSKSIRFKFWGKIKQEIYSHSINTQEQLMNLITYANHIKNDEMGNIYESIKRRWRTCIWTRYMPNKSVSTYPRPKTSSNTRETKKSDTSLYLINNRFSTYLYMIFFLSWPNEPFSINFTDVINTLYSSRFTKIPNKTTP